MTKIASNLQIDSARLWDTIHETAKFGATPKGGVRRLTLGPEDKQVRDWCPLSRPAARVRPRLVGRRPRRPGPHARLDVRLTKRPRHVEAAGRARLASRHAALRR